MSYMKAENHTALINTLTLKAEHVRIVTFVLSYYRAIAVFFATSDVTKAVKCFASLKLDDSQALRLADVFKSATSCKYSEDTLKRYKLADSLTREELRLAVIDAYLVFFNQVKASNVPYLSKNEAIKRADNAHMRDLTMFSRAEAKPKAVKSAKAAAIASPSSELAVIEPASAELITVAAETAVATV